MHRRLHCVLTVFTTSLEIAFFLLFVLDTNSRAQAKPQIRDTPGDSRFISISHSVHPLATSINDLGRVESGHAMQRAILLLAPSAEQEEQLKQFLNDTQNAKSLNYHRWLAPEEFAARFAPADEDVAKIRDWLEHSGFRVGNVARGKRWIEFSGTAQQVESAFHTEMHYYAVNGVLHIANALDIGVPLALAPVARGVLSLNNFPKAPHHTAVSHSQINARGNLFRVQPYLTASGVAGNVFSLAPDDFAAIYNTKPLIAGGNDGKGVSIAIAGQSQIQIADVQSFRNIFGLAPNDPNIIVSGADPGLANINDIEESTLDVEWAGAAAPGAAIDLVIAATTDATNGVDLAASYAVDNLLAPILTYTYGGCENSLGPSGNAFYNALWQQAAAEGISVFVATGDNGAAGCDSASGNALAAQGLAVNGAAATPYNIAVGGTQFNDVGQEGTFWNITNDANFGSAKGYIPESVWNESCDSNLTASATNCAFTGSGNQPVSLLASGGGASTIYSKPSWQVGANVPKDGMRDLPDLSLASGASHDGVVICISANGTPCQTQISGAQTQLLQWTTVGGTSAAAPAMAGIMALVEQKNGTFQGQANFNFYKLAATKSCNSSTESNPAAQNSCVFYDITAGSNAVPCAGGSANCSSSNPATDGFLTGHNAGPGYDLATGLGSVNAVNLVSNWKSAANFPSITTLQSSVVNFVHGQPTMITGAVQPNGANGVPSGAIALKTDAGKAADVVALSSGNFSASINDLPGGQYNLLARYPGDAMFAESESPVVTLNISPEPSMASVTISGLTGASTPFGTPVGVRVNVQGSSGNGIASGTVTMRDAANLIGMFPLTADGNVFLWTGSGFTYQFAKGSHTVSASFSGDSSFAPGNPAQAAPFTIGKALPFVVVGSNLSPNVATPTQPITLHAVVSGSQQTSATGTIRFTDNGNPLGAAPITLQAGGLFGSQAQAILITTLAAGNHDIGANYDGSADPDYDNVSASDTSNEFTTQITVTTSPGNKSTTSLAPALASANLGDVTLFAVGVSAASAPTGTVTLYNTVGAVSSPMALNNGSATIPITWTQAGAATIYAVFSGDAANASSASKLNNLTVHQGTPTVTLAAPASAAPNHQISLNVAVSGIPSNASLPFPTGQIQFLDSLNGAAPQPLAGRKFLAAGNGNVAVFSLRIALSLGQHVITANYLGDNNWSAALSLPANISSGDFTITINPNPLPITGGSPANTTISIAPQGGFTGTIALTCPDQIPSGYNCAIQPPSIVIPGAQLTATLTLTPANSTGGTTAMALPAHRDAWWGLSAGTGLMAFALFLWPAGRRRQFGALLSALLCVASFAIGCGGGGGAGGGGGGGPVPSSTSITPSAAKAPFGTSENFSITVNSTQTPGGTVQLSDLAQPSGLQAVSSSTSVHTGAASISTAGLAVGFHPISAHYNGDANTLPSTSSVVNVVITGSLDLQVTGQSASGVTHTAIVTSTVN